MQYIIKLSMALAVVYLFYWLLLRRLTFYNWNRWYLLGYSLLCFVIPLIDVFGLLQRNGWQDAAVVSYIPALVSVDTDAVVESNTVIDWWIIFAAIIAAGCLFMLGRLLVQYFSLQRLRASAVLLYDGPVKLYHLDKKIIPFSTRSAIYINRHLHNEQELKDIIRHEFIHVKQRHSFDLWWGELLCIINWYNPFAWLIRKAIRQNLEFIADHQVLQSGLDRKQYQYLLLKVTGIAPFSIASNFNFSSLKKRIAMMNKNRSAQVNLMRFLFILPLLVVVLLAFRNVAVNKSNTYQEISITDTIPPPPANMEELFKKRGIKEISIKTRENDKKDVEARITFTNGKVKVFNLSDPEEREAFEREYGDLKPPAPPLPPMPAAAPRGVAAPAKVGQPGMPAPPAPKAVPAKPGAPRAVPTPPAPVETFEPAEAPKPVEAPVKISGTGRIKIVEASGSASATGVANVQVDDKPAAITNVQVTSPMQFVAADEVTIQPRNAKNARTTLTADVIELSPVAVAGTPNVNEEKSLLLEIYNTTTRTELEQMTQQLKGKGFTLALSSVQFENGSLISLEGTVSNGVTKSWFSGDHFKTITISVGKQDSNRYYITVKGGSISIKD